MLRNSLEELDESTIASALGMSGIAHRLHAGLLKKLHPTVTKAFEAAKITLRCTRELAHVKPERQAEILALMESCNDYSITFARGMILKTQVAKRAKANGTKTPWTQADDQKNDLLKRLREAEQQQDFYSGLYRQYTTNLLKLVIYVRSLLANERVCAYLETHHGELVKVFEQIVSSTREMMPRNGWSAGSETCAPEVTACSPRRCECVNRRCIGAPGKCSAVGRPRCASRRSTRRAFIPIPENISPIGNRCCRCWRTDSARGCRFAGVKCARILGNGSGFGPDHALARRHEAGQRSEVDPPPSKGGCRCEAMKVSIVQAYRALTPLYIPITRT
jgi:hypothetical protein